MVDQELVSWIKEHLKKGYSIQELKAELKKAGHTANDINEAVAAADSGAAPAPQATSPRTPASSGEIPGLFSKFKLAFLHPRQLFESVQGEGLGGAFTHRDTQRKAD